MTWTVENRRTVAAAYVLATAGFVGIGAIVDSIWFVIAWLVGPFAVAAFTLTAATSGLAEAPIGRLDERQQDVRRRMFGDPYQFGATLGLAAGLVAAWAISSDDEALGAGTLIAVIGVLYGIQAVVIAWTMPAEPDDE